jgi:hypothetical protein
MLANKQVYMSLVRERTNETIVVEMNKALTTIKKYDEKQRFMNLLGQEDFWKKNRLELWAQLTQDAVSDEAFLAIAEQDRLYISRVPFKHTQHMLNDIKIELSNEADKLVVKSREQPVENWRVDGSNNIYENGERHWVSRAVRADVPYFYVRTEDIENFNRDFNRLLNKYAVKNPLRLKNGVRRFKTSSVAKRYVERYFGFARTKDYYSYQDW